MGEDYIGKGFEYAHAVDPQAKLFYSDYYTENSVKRDKIYQIVREPKDKNTPIRRVGSQGYCPIYGAYLPGIGSINQKVCQPGPRRSEQTTNRILLTPCVSGTLHYPVAN
ncbi:endo-1,4-beta-xylanase [Persicitalea jodogahamensis]|uniref:endo-1,4-beta-xylanase n=1 Tax=Persicitalea jodogahamensis TaxID=402147 RepID=UPI0027E3EB90|nr:endo-1,4-beta-xylanase [Persicitalea jodogahamensis]